MKSTANSQLLTANLQLPTANCQPPTFLHTITYFPKVNPYSQQKNSKINTKYLREIFYVSIFVLKIDPKLEIPYQNNKRKLEHTYPVIEIY